MRILIAILHYTIIAIGHAELVVPIPILIEFRKYCMEHWYGIFPIMFISVTTAVFTFQRVYQVIKYGFKGFITLPNS